jgi:hypothetical protein
MGAPVIKISFCEVSHHVHDFVHGEVAHFLHLLQSLQHVETKLAAASAELNNVQRFIDVQRYLAPRSHAVLDETMQHLHEYNSSVNIIIKQ